MITEVLNIIISNIFVKFACQRSKLLIILFFRSFKCLVINISTIIYIYIYLQCTFSSCLNLKQIILGYKVNMKTIRLRIVYYPYKMCQSHGIEQMDEQSLGNTVVNFNIFSIMTKLLQKDQIFENQNFVILSMLNFEFETKK